MSRTPERGRRRASLRVAGLRWRLAGSHALLALLLVLVASVVLGLQTSHLRRSEAAQGVVRDATVEAANASPVLDNPQLLGEVVDDETTGGRQSELVDVHGAVLMGSLPPAAAGRAHAAAEVALRGVTSGGAVRGRDLVVGAAPIVSNDQIVGAAVAVERIGDVPLWIRPVGLALAVGLVLVVMAGAIGWLLAGQVARPVRSLTDASHRLALGWTGPDPLTGVRSPIPEVATLTAAFERLAERVRTLANRARHRETGEDAALRRLSHQLRTPVAVLALRVDQLDEPLASVMGRQVAASTETAERLTELARRPDTDRSHVADFDIVPVVNGVVHRLAPLAEWARLDLTSSIAADGRPATVRGDPDDVEDAIVNVVENAIKFTPSPGVVHVSCRVERPVGEVVIEVDDSGPGIDPAERAMVVQPWVRGRAGQDAPGTGLGLGLAVDAITRCGGRLEFDDAPIGGACIRLVLPLAGHVPMETAPGGAGTVRLDPPVERSEPSGTAGRAGDVEVDRLDPAH